MFLERIFGYPPELGVPEGWRIDLLDNVSRRGSGHTPDKKNPEYWNGGIKWVSLTDSDKLDNVYIYETDKEISELGIKNSSAVKHPAGTVILSRDAGVGKSAIIASEMAVSQHFMAWSCGNELDNYYLYYWLQLMKPEFERIAVGSTIKTIGLPYFRKPAIPLPPFAEQRKIAAILGTWDEAIALVERLIAALQRRKQGLMQRLLTGHARLDWQATSIGEVVELIVSNVDKKTDTGEQAVRLCNYMDVYYENYITNSLPFMEATANPNEIDRFSLKKHDVVITKDSETVEDIAKAAVVTEELNNVVCGYHLAILRPDDSKVYGPFLREMLMTPDVHYQFERAANGVTRFGLTLSAINNVCFYLPPLLKQVELAQILSLSDEWVVGLQKYVVQLRAQKQGLMQRLLTGQTHVQADEDDHLTPPPPTFTQQPLSM